MFYYYWMVTKSTEQVTGEYRHSPENERDSVQPDRSSRGRVGWSLGNSVLAPFTFLEQPPPRSRKESMLSPIWRGQVLRRGRERTLLLIPHSPLLGFVAFSCRFQAGHTPKLPSTWGCGLQVAEALGAPAVPWLRQLCCWLADCCCHLVVEGEKCLLYTGQRKEARLIPSLSGVPIPPGLRPSGPDLQVPVCLQPICDALL